MSESIPSATPETSTPAASAPSAPAKPRKRRKNKVKAKARVVKSNPIRATFLSRQLPDFARQMIAPRLAALDTSRVFGFPSLHEAFVSQYGLIPPDIFKEALSVLGVNIVQGNRISMSINLPTSQQAPQAPVYGQTSQAQGYVQPQYPSHPVGLGDPRPGYPGQYGPRAVAPGQNGNGQQVSPALARMVSERAALDAGIDLNNPVGTNLGDVG